MAELRAHDTQRAEITTQVGAPGTNGLSAYEIAVLHGYPDTEEEWLLSLKGAMARNTPKQSTQRILNVSIRKQTNLLKPTKWN